MKLMPKFQRIPFVSPKNSFPQAKPAHAKFNPSLMCLLFACGLVLSALSVGTADLTMDFFANDDGFHSSNERIRVRNLTASSDVLFFGDSWIRNDSISRLVPTRVIKKSNQNGRANLPRINLVEKAIWCAVDLPTGRYIIDSVTSYAGTRQEVSQLEMFQTANSFNFDGRRLDLLIVRPGQSAWTASVVDGGPNDGGASPGVGVSEGGLLDEQVLIPFGSLQTIWSQGLSGGNFDSPRAGDLILGINPDDMTYFAFLYGGVN